MRSERIELDASERLRLGRQIVDGASFEWLAERSSRSKDEISAAWEYCREMLSRYFAAGDREDFHLLSDEEIQTDSERCLRLLLEWREACERSLIVEQFETPVPGDDQSPVTNDDDGGPD